MAESKEDTSTCSNSRRQLFPVIDDDNDELGHISPLDNDNVSVTPKHLLQHLICKPQSSSFSKTTFSDYVILENLHQSGLGDETETPSPDRSLYHDNNISLKTSFDTDPILDDTPSKITLNETFKTPQDSFSANSNLPKLIRKTFSESSVAADEQRKRKVPFSESPPTSKQSKLDHSSKVRTSLFSKGDPVIPASSFYSKSQNTSAERFIKNNIVQKSVKALRSKPVYLCNRGSKKRKKFGEINAGVKHKIRKPKVKKLTKDDILKASLSIIENSELNEYLKDVENLQVYEKQIQALKPIENIVENLNEDKENRRNEKRARSESPKLNNKFFKSRRSNTTVAVDRHSKPQFNDIKFCLVEKKDNTSMKPVCDLNAADLSDLTVPENDYLIPQDKIDDVLSFLDDSNENVPHPESTQTVTLKAYDSVILSDNSIQLHTPMREESSTENSVLLSPTSQMCNMTSDLALNSPKNAKQNITNILNKSTAENAQVKLFPIFQGACGVDSGSKKKPKTPSSSTKKFKALAKDQMLLDAGQKRFGVKQCPECELVYHMGDPNDETRHRNYHNAVNVFRFNGWKDERLVGQYPDGRIIRVFPSDPKPWLKRVKELLNVVNRDLGYYEMDVELTNSQVYLYIKGKSIVGCVVAEPKTTAYQMLSNTTGVDLCSEQSYPIKCGINRIWVSQTCRRQGIGTALLDSVRGNFMYGNILSKNDLAFTSPTELGKMFATKYFGTSNYLIYLS